MKYLIALLCVICIYTSCAEEEVLYWTHMYGFAKLESNGSGINDLNLKIGDIDPENTSQTRVRETVTAHSPDSLHGYFEMDSICFATSSSQGSNIVWILLDSQDNPGYTTQSHYIDLEGPIDTIDFYVTP